MKVVLAVSLLIFSISLHAQKDVTKFLGIPVDGSKAEMIKKIKDKGYTDNPYSKDVLDGEFNGMNVNIHIVTNNNKVCRIMVCDAHLMNEVDIKIRFNKLCKQFENNSKYMFVQDYTIPAEEDIAYEIAVHKKKYEAIFYQNPATTASVVATLDNIKSIISSKYTEEQLENPTKEMQKELSKVYTEHASELYLKRPVWFMISGYSDKYYIAIFYDNEYNFANGEDL